MKRENIYFDIETAPLDMENLKNVMPEFKARGNLKDQSKIEADIQEKIALFIANAALNAYTGKVVAIGYTEGDANVECECECEDFTESDLIRRFWEYITDERGCMFTNVIGHNSNNFDIPFLIRRSWILGIKIPVDVYSFKGGRIYLNNFFKDTMLLWGCGTQDKISLDSLAKSFGVGKKNGNGADFYSILKSNRDKAEEYLTNDVILTRKVAIAMNMGNSGILENK